MGSFNGTCSVSSLPIYDGTPVRYMLLTRNPYAHIDSSVDADTGGVEESLQGLWVPRTFPIRAKYNDYGSIKDYKNDLATKAILEAFKYDLIERGVGSNQCHDVPTILKDMTFESLLEAIWERRVIVKGNYSDHAQDMAEITDVFKRVDALLGDKAPKREPKKEWVYVPPDYIPTLSTVSAVLNRAKIQTNSNTEQGVYVTESEAGVVGVREAGYGVSIESTLLQQVKTILDDTFATVIVAGLDNAVELLVYPQPRMVKNEGSQHSFALHRADPARQRDKNLIVAACMVREDVWQVLLSMPSGERWWEDGDKKAYELPNLKAAARALFQENTTPAVDPMDRILERARGTSPMAQALTPHLSVLSPGSHWKMLGRKVRQGTKLPEKQLHQFIDDAAEYTYVSRRLFDLRTLWRPFATNGEQVGNYKPFSTYYEKMLALTKTAAVNREE